MQTLATVFHNGNPLLAKQEVLDEMNLKDGQDITEGQMWKIIELNAASLLAEIETRKLAGEKGLPDTSDLQKLLRRK